MICKLIWLFFFFFYKSRPPYQEEMGVPEVGMSEEWSFLQDRLPVKFKDPKFKHEIFVRIDMKHSYFSNYFIICLQSIFSVV